MRALHLTYFPLIFSLSMAGVALSQAPEPFHFWVGLPVVDTAGPEEWAAFVRPDTSGEVARSGPATFRIRLAIPATKQRKGMSVMGTLVRGDPGGAEFFNFELGSTFLRIPGNGGMMAMSIQPADSLPFTATVQTTGDEKAPWTALVKLHNGGQFVLALDRASGWGEFRPIPKYSSQVFFEIERLIAPR